MILKLSGQDYLFAKDGEKGGLTRADEIHNEAEDIVKKVSSSSNTVVIHAVWECIFL